MVEDVGSLTLESVSPHLGTAFRVDPGDGTAIDLTLAEVKDLGPRPEYLPQQSSRPRAFALYLRGPKGRVLPQRIYSMTHEALGSLAIFIVPIGPDGAGMKYEAIFN